jgi:hypothetical protein
VYEALSCIYMYIYLIVNTAITSLDKAVGLEDAVALFHEVQASNCVALNCVTYRHIYRHTYIHTYV